MGRNSISDKRRSNWQCNGISRQKQGYYAKRKFYLGCTQKVLESKWIQFSDPWDTSGPSEKKEMIGSPQNALTFFIDKDSSKAFTYNLDCLRKVFRNSWWTPPPPSLLRPIICLITEPSPHAFYFLCEKFSQSSSIFVSCFISDIRPHGKPGKMRFLSKICNFSSLHSGCGCGIIMGLNRVHPLKSEI